MQTTAEVFYAYRALYNAVTERYRERIALADPRVGKPYAFHLTHNWGNDSARALLARFRRVSSWVARRGEREYDRARHREHDRRSRPHWCSHCTVKVSAAEKA